MIEIAVPEVFAELMISCLVPVSVSLAGATNPTPWYWALVPLKVIDPRPDFIVIRPHWYTPASSRSSPSPVAVLEPLMLMSPPPE